VSRTGRTEYLLEASALGSLIAACPTWKRREEEREYQLYLMKASDRGRNIKF